MLPIYQNVTNDYLLIRYDDFRRDQSLYDSDRRYQRPYDTDGRYLRPYDSDQRYKNTYGDYRRFSNSYDNYRRYPVGLDGRLNDLFLEDNNRVQYPAGVRLSTTAASPLDRGQLLDRGVGLRERVLGLQRGTSLDSRGLGLEQRLDLGLDREQGLVLDRGQDLVLDRGQGFGLYRGLGVNRGLVGLESERGLDRGQILSTSSPEISVSLDPNSST